MSVPLRVLSSPTSKSPRAPPAAPPSPATPSEWGVDMEDEERTAIPFLQLGTRIGETAHLLVQRLAARALDEARYGGGHLGFLPVGRDGRSRDVIMGTTAMRRERCHLLEARRQLIPHLSWHRQKASTRRHYRGRRRLRRRDATSQCGRGGGESRGGDGRSSP